MKITASKCACFDIVNIYYSESKLISFTFFPLKLWFWRVRIGRNYIISPIINIHWM